MREVAPVGDYPRMCRISDESVAVVYENGYGSTVIRYSGDEGRSWSRPDTLFRGFTARNGRDSAFVWVSNPELIRLADGVPCEYSQTLEFPGAGLPELRWKRENARLSAEIVSGNDRRQIRILVRDPVIPPSEYEETGALVREFTRELKQWRMP